MVLEEELYLITQCEWTVMHNIAQAVQVQKCFQRLTMKI